MAVTLIVTKSLDDNLQRTGETIALDDWFRCVERDAELRLQAGGTTVTNPRTKQRISLGPPPGQTELHTAGAWVPFLGYRRGELTMTLAPELHDEANPVRRKIAEIAAALGAVITHDAGDDILRW